ncbi:MAG: hypothetical protein R3B96_11025 [Pirellulaceae bacterium]
MQAEPSVTGSEPSPHGSSDKPISFTSVQAYRSVVLALAVLVIGIAIWPKQTTRPICVASIEVALDPPFCDSAAGQALLSDVYREVSETEALLEVVDLAWNQWAQTQDSSRPLDRAGWAEWLAANLVVKGETNTLDDYLLVHVAVEGIDDPFVPHLVNQVALSLSTRIDRELTRDDIFRRWERERDQLQQTLASRRDWLERFDETLSRQASELQVITAGHTGTVPTTSTSLVSADRSSLNQGQLPPDTALLLAEIEMRADELQRLTEENFWTAANPERLRRLQDLDQLKSRACSRTQAIGRSPRDFPLLDSVTHQVQAAGTTTIHENEYFRSPSGNRSRAGDGRRGLEQLSSTASARSMNSRPTRLHCYSTMSVSCCSGDARGSTGTAAPTHARVLELAHPATKNVEAIRSSHWLLLGLMSTALAMAFGWNLARQPSRFFTTDEVGEELALPVLGVIAGDGHPPRGFWATVKRHERRIQWGCEVVLLATLAVVLLSLLINPQLFGVMVDRPLDGLARSLQTVFG